ncbi:DNA primase domain-containing protein [Anaerohalosphaera lusitana]|uniref:DNA primase domain-containing protein n=1 Tax=Anaerohalosphaera lusitana TaxID=1936003 RepID=A0A1U9NJX6_9BACT|nr:CHC2 zinc finger domain-containing protein [Anaerohalosphaera lusitana]AQT68243.1 DNA primase domain-containing protein [Anaerohalosphaera lusitana]
MSKIQIEISTEEFLEQIHGKNALIYFNVASNTWRNKPQSYSEAKRKLKYRNSQGDDIGFIVNSGGSKKEDINRINACFIDWDCGRDANGEYFSLHYVKKKKDEFVKYLSDSPLNPSYIVETRNGFHVYWLTKDYSVTPEQLVNIQKRLIVYFNADPSCTTPNRVMRLPGYLWIKSKSNCSPFNVRIYNYNSLRYSYNDFDASFPFVSDDDFSEYLEENKKGRKSDHNNSFSYYNNTCDIYEGTFPDDIKEKDSLTNNNSIIDILKKKNLADYLGIEYDCQITPDKSLHLRCPFHDDSQESASIFVDKQTGHFRIYCHSSHCGFNGSIIDVVMKQKNCDVSDAVRHLIQHYDIQKDEKWKKDKRREIDDNINIVERINELKDEYPNLYHFVNRVRDDLLSKLRFARDKIALRTSKGDVIVICSLRKFNALKGGRRNDVGRQNERIDRYCVLGLMRKLPDEEITKSLMMNLQGQRDSLVKGLGVKGDKANIYRSQCYSFPAYTPDVLAEAEETAKKLRENGVKMNSISRDMIWQVLGPEKAAQIYPQVHKQGISSAGNKFMGKVESCLLQQLHTRGYARVPEIISEITQEYDWKSVTDRRVKKYIPGLLTKHGLAEVTCTKALKEQFRIISRGYPKIVIKKSVLASGAA